MGNFALTRCKTPNSAPPPSSGSNVTSLTYTPGTEILNLTTDQPASFNAVIKGVKVNNTYFVDVTYGNNATAVPGSMNYKYQTVDTALLVASAISDSLVVLMPGNHILTTTVTLANVLRIHMMPGAVLIVNTSVGFSINPAQRLYVDGEGDFQLVGILFANSSPGSSIPAECHVKCRTFGNSGANNIGDTTSMVFSIEADSINDVGFDGQGWCFGNIKCDFWQSSRPRMLSLRDFSAFNGPTKYDEYGPQIVTVKGRYKPRCQWYNPSAISQALFTEAGLFESYKTQVYLDMDFDCTDSYFVDHGRGMIVHSGNLYHGKSDTFGNELPWYFTSQDIVSDQYKPYFEHVKGSGAYVSRTNVLFGTSSLNNELISISRLCTIKLGGRYENSGENTGAGAWPIIFIQNANTNPGSSTIILDGDFRSAGGDVSPIRHVGIGPTGHTIELICHNSSIYTRNQYSIDTNVELPIYTYHSLAANQPFNPLVVNALSVDKNFIDSQIRVNVPEYGR